MNNVVISFFKENQIQYKINKDRCTCTYPCFFCGGQATITLKRTYFVCNHCHRTGTLVHLIKFIEEQPSLMIEKIQQAEFYDEDKEIKELTKLLGKLGNATLADSIKKKVLRLLENNNG